MERPHLRQLPGLRYLLRLWGRALTLYVVLRLFAATGNVKADRIMGDAPGSPWSLDWRALLVLFALVAGLVWVFANRRRELALLHNLGVDTRTVLALALAPAIGLEVLIQWWLT